MREIRRKSWLLLLVAMMFSASNVFGQVTVTVNGVEVNTSTAQANIDTAKHVYTNNILYLYSGFGTTGNAASTAKGAITSTGALTIEIVGGATVGKDSTVYAAGLLTIQGSGALTVKTTNDDSVVVKGNGVTIASGVTVTATGTDTTVVQAGAGPVVINGKLTVTGGGTAKSSIVGSTVTTGALSTLESVSGDSVNIVAAGAVDLSAGTVTQLGVVTSGGNIILGGGVEPTANGGGSLTTTNGAITYGAKAGKKIAGLAATGDITINTNIASLVDSIKTVNGAVLISARLDSVSKIYGKTVTSGDQISVKADSIFASGALILGGTTTSRIITSTNGPITLNGATKAIGTGGGIITGTGNTGIITINSRVDTATVIYGKTITSADGIGVKADSIAATGAISIGGTTVSRVITSPAGPIDIIGNTTIVKATTGNANYILSNGEINLRASAVTVNPVDTAGIIGGTVNIKSGRVTINAQELSLTTSPNVIDPADSKVGILASGPITVDDGATLIGGGVVGLGSSSILWNGTADTVNLISTLGTGSITIGSTGRLRSGNEDSVDVNIVSNSGKIELLNTNTVNVASIKSTTGDIIIDGAVIASDSIATGGALSISKNVTVTRNRNLTTGTKESAIHGKTIDITGGTIKATSAAQNGLYATGNITVSSPAILSEVDSITSVDGDITLSNKISTGNTIKGLVALNGTITVNSDGGGGIGVVSGGDVTIASGANVVADTVIQKENDATLSIAGTLKVGNINLEKGELEVLSGGTLNLSKDSIIKATSIYLAGTVTGQNPDTVVSTDGEITITNGAHLQAGKIKSATRLTVSAGGKLTLKVEDEKAPQASAEGPAFVTAPDGLYITGKGSTVTTAGTGEILDVAANTAVSVKSFGTLIRSDKSASRIGTVTLSDVDGSATVQLRPGYPRITAGTTPGVTFANNAITITLVTDSVTFSNDVSIWLDTESDTYQRFRGAFSPEDTTTVAANKYTTELSSLSVSPALLTTNNLSIVTERGVWHFTIDNPSPSGTTNRDDGNIYQPTTGTWAADNNWDPALDYDFRTAAYSNETITVEFTFAKNASKNETIEFNDKTSTKDGIMDFLNPSTDILEAGKNKVEVVFTFKKEANEELRRAILTRASKIGAQPIKASIKGDENGEFGTATSDSIDLYDAVTLSTTFVAGTIGYGGTVELGIKGGTGAELVRVKDANGEVVVDWTPASTFTEDLTPARLAKIFEAGATLEVKAPNTGNTITQTISGPNTISGGNGGGSSPDANHRIRLEYAPELQTPTGVYPSTNQSFTFKVARPEGELNDLVVTVVGVSETGDYFTSSAIATPVENLEHDGWSVLVTNITTDIRITISFRASTGVNSIVSTSVWSSGNSITISSSSRGIARVYSLVGTLVSEFTYNEGTTSIALPVGTYVVVLSDGTRTKLVIR
jgi:hypothetical protein